MNRIEKNLVDIFISIISISKKLLILLGIVIVAFIINGIIYQLSNKKINLNGAIIRKIKAMYKELF